MTQKNLFSNYQKEMMAEYLQNQFDLYSNLWDRAFYLFSRPFCFGDRQDKVNDLMISFHSKMKLIIKLQRKIYV